MKYVICSDIQEHIKGNVFLYKEQVWVYHQFQFMLTELMQEYGVQKLIRVGTCGAIQKDVKVP